MSPTDPVAGSLRFRPHAVTKPWGGYELARRLARVRGQGVAGLPIGESWEFVPGGEHASVIEGGVHDGRRIDDALTTPPPVMVKLLDSATDLSLQVHSRKWEAWLILASHPGAQLYSGLREGVRRDDLTAALDACDSPEIRRCLRSIELAPGDFLVNPPGTLHAIGGGFMLLEVQTPFEETWRLWDWDRDRQADPERPLHRDEAMTALDETSRPALLPPTSRAVQAPGFEISLPAREGGRACLRGPGFEIDIELGTPLGSTFDLRLISQDVIRRSE